MLFPDAKLIIFSKAPEAGQVKTRLIPALGIEGATRLHKEMLEQKLRLVSENQIAATDLYCSPDHQHPYFQQVTSSLNLDLHTQSGEDLGQRMANALQTALNTHTMAVIIGSDSPPLDLAYIKAAFQALEQGSDAVIGPAIDGGYVLLGSRRFSNKLFACMNWGTDRVLTQTRERLQQLDYSWIELDPLWDIDRPEDLIQYQTQLHSYGFVSSYNS